MKGIIFDIDHFAVHDGDGIRTCIYLKGCPLRCVWCHSPESQEKKPQLLFAASRCTGCGLCVQECPVQAQKIENGVRSFHRKECVMCNSCAEVCSTGALLPAGKIYTPKEAVREAVEDRSFFKNSGGGVTVSGGEVLMQPEFTFELLKILKEEKIHTIVETSGYGREEDLLRLAGYTDIFYFDYKLGDKELFRRYVKGDLDIVLGNLRKLRRITDKIVLRLPVIPGITDTRENINTLYHLAQELNIYEIHFLPYNTSAGAKYEWCGREFGLGDLETDMEKLEKYQKEAPRHIKVHIVA